MLTRRRRVPRILAVLVFLASFFLTYIVSADNPSAGKTRKAVETAQAATKNAQGAAETAAGTALAAGFGTKYPDNDNGKAAKAADESADASDAAADAAAKAADQAREKACESGKEEDAKAADDADKAAQDAEAKAAAADSAADAADAKAEPFGKKLQKKKRDADRVARAALLAARKAICFALQCARLMDESSESSRKKKAETIQTIEGLDSSVDKLLAMAPRTGNGKVETAQGLRRVIFDTTPGRVSVYLPDDMMAGDTISGTVVAEPKGQNESERARNASELSGMVIDIARPKRSGESTGVDVKVPFSATTAPFIFKTPPTPPTADAGVSQADTVVIRLTNTSGLPVAGTKEVPIEIVSLHLQSVAPLTIQLPTIGQQGRPIEIIGPFDGNSSNTKLMYGPKGSSIQDFEKNTENVTGGFGLLQPLAESPRKCVTTAPANVTGQIELYVKDGRMESTVTFRNVGVNLTAPKTSLLKGEHTTLKIEVNGLQGIDKTVPLTLQSAGVITMEGGTYQPLVIQPSQVAADGRYTTTRGITGVQAGAWQATVTVVTAPPYIALRDFAPPQQLVINSGTGQYVFCGTGEKLSGNGHVKVDGCDFYFFQDSNERLLMGVLNACEQSSNRYWVFAGGLTYIPVDFRISTDNAKPPKTRVYFNPLNRPAPPVQDVSAFATCP